MASKHPLKTVLWIDSSPVRKALMNEIFKSAGIEAFFFLNITDLSPDIVESLSPTAILIHPDFLDKFETSGLDSYKSCVITLGKKIDSYLFLELPLKPLEVIANITKLFI